MASEVADARACGDTRAPAFWTRPARVHGHLIPLFCKKRRMKCYEVRPAKAATRHEWKIIRIRINGVFGHGEETMRRESLRSSKDGNMVLLFLLVCGLIMIMVI